MGLYLVQHGEAKNEGEDPERPLTTNGKRDVVKVARHLAGYIRPDEILHSPKLRAKQTADIFASQFKCRSVEMPDLKPNDDSKIARNLVESQSKNLMLVGHLPHLSRLASLLLTGSPEPETVKFRTAAVVCLMKEEKWKVSWLLTPELV